jgi:hypothetical protein
LEGFSSALLSPYIPLFHHPFLLAGLFQLIEYMNIIIYKAFGQPSPTERLIYYYDNIVLSKNGGGVKWTYTENSWLNTARPKASAISAPVKVRPG